MRKSLFWPLLVLGSLGPAAVRAADPPPGAPSDAAIAAKARAQTVAAICAQVACRKSGRAINLRLADGGNYTVHISPYPYLDPGGNVVLYPGETITLGFAKAGETLNPPVLVSVSEAGSMVDIGPPPAAAMTLSFTLSQDEDKPGMTLVARNTVAAMVKYEARISLLAAGGVRIVNSSTCPLMPPQGNAPSFSGFETWPQPIGMMVIGNIRALAPGTPVTC